ncbi:MAG: pilus assembly protein [Nocardiopsaceae bacterium]|nr:pilus assembly protein [Nocardiopsaceae bacterium]
MAAEPHTTGQEVGRPSKQRKRHILRNDQGSQFVEFAIYFPIFLFVLTIALEAFFGFAAMERMNNAARVSADSAGSSGIDHAENLARSSLPGYLQDEAEIQVYPVEHGYATEIEVRFPLVFSFAGLDIPLTRTVEMPR